MCVTADIRSELRYEKNAPGPCTERIARLRERYLQWRPAICLERALAYTEAYKETEGQTAVIRRAKGLLKTCQTKSIIIQDDELIVGMPGSQPRAGIFCPDIAWRWLAKEIDTISTREQDPYLLSEEQKEILRTVIFPYWQGKSAEEYYLANLPQETREIAVETGIIDVELKSQNGAGEFSPGYGNILLKKGYRGIKEEAEKTLATLDLTNPDEYDKAKFLEAVCICCDAAKVLAERYAAKAREMAEAEQDSQRKEELLQIAQICEWVPWNPPRTFYECLQTIWFSQVLLFLEENAPSYSPGRMDQYLYPYYRNDLEAGRLTKEKAQELLECLWIKMAEMTWLLNENCSKYFAGYMPFQNVTVGGQTRNGRDATNELSYMMLQAQMDVRLFQPSLSVRIHKETPDEFLIKVCELIRLGMGFPAIHNDETTIRMMLKKGCSMEDARDYCLVGCVEPNIHGKMSQWSDGGHYNFGAAVEFALTDGYSLVHGRKLGVPTGDPRSFGSFSDLMAAVKKQLAYFIRHIVIANLVAERAHAEFLPKPLSSSLVEGCVVSGKDITQGGAVYNAGPALIGTGIADLADSLAAVKRLVFEEKVLTMDELCRALARNFEGMEEIRQMLINRAPKYGNDVDEVDNIALELTDFVAREVEKYRGYKGCKIINGLYPVSSHVPHGKVVGALPSGRRATEPLADGCSPFHGMDRKGPTAVIKSVCKINHEDHTAGTLLNMKLNPGLLKDENGLRNLASLIRTHCDLGGYHIQFNVVSSDTLRAAQKNPKEYRDLIVRVAGYSAYFVDLCKEIQDDIINRTEHMNW